MEIVEIKYKTNFFSTERTIVFSDESIEFYSEQNLLIRFKKEEIKDFRFGVKWITGIEFTIGRVYSVDIRNNKNEIIKVRLRSLYGINRNRLFKKYSGIINNIYEHAFDEYVRKSCQEIENGKTVTVSDIVFNSEGICIDPKKKNSLIKWDDLVVNKYTYYFTLASRKQPDFYKAFTFLTDWNSPVVFSISETILRDKKLQPPHMCCE